MPIGIIGCSRVKIQHIQNKTLCTHMEVGFKLENECGLIWIEIHIARKDKLLSTVKKIHG